MKKITLTILTLSAVVLLGACNNKNNETKESSGSAMSEKVEQSTTSSSKQTEKASIFTATLVEDAVANDGTDQSIRLVLTDVTAEEDPENIANMMKSDGVILNVVTDQLQTGLTMDQLKKGEQVRFTLTGTPAMTMSIPPQVMGNAVQLVEKVK